MRIVVVTGMSGSGKSTASKALEDVGYYCVDNIPVALLSKLIDLFGHSSGEVRKLALLIDGREREFLAGIEATIREIKARGSHLEVLYLDARDDVLLRRFSETRRKHPFSPEGSVQAGIRHERKQLSAVRELADMVLDTSDYNVHQLREFIMQRFGTAQGREKLRVHLKSFAFNNGIPPEGDVVLDVRFLVNPFFQEGLRDKDGRDDEVRGFVKEDPDWPQFIARLRSLLDLLLPRYLKEGKSYLTLAIGCTGGRHRSVAVVEELAPILSGGGWPVSVSHREVESG
ncbi:MAG: RNase adapter RapZ [Nitrospirae bacterium]|nr:RNase adapter RapZ [Nitrospirota bacterium]